MRGIFEDNDEVCVLLVVALMFDSESRLAGKILYVLVR